MGQSRFLGSTTAPTTTGTIQKVDTTSHLDSRKRSHLQGVLLDAESVVEHHWHAVGAERLSTCYVSRGSCRQDRQGISSCTAQ